MTEFNEGNYLGDLLKQEAPGRYQPGQGDRPGRRRRGPRALSLGEVIGKITKGAATEDHSGNTGAGVMGEITLGALAEVGDYVLTCIDAAEDAGTFQVVSPSGNVLPPLTVGVAYAGDHLNMTLADGDPDFAEGDVFTITVAAGIGKMTCPGPCRRGRLPKRRGDHGRGGRPPGRRGRNYGVALVRDAVVMASALVWPDGATEGQKTAALAQLCGFGHHLQRGGISHAGYIQQPSLCLGCPDRGDQHGAQHLWAAAGAEPVPHKAGEHHHRGH